MEKTTILVISLLPLLLGACQDIGKGMNSAADKTTQEVYFELMDSILNSKISSTTVGSHSKAGDVNPYREGYPGYPHKALTACLVWNMEEPSVKREAWFSWASNKWGYAEAKAIDKCEDYKKENGLTCKCQMIDHDDVNVLQVPSDYRAAYENGAKVLGASNVPAVETKGQRFFLDINWNNVLARRSVFTVSIIQNGSSGTLKFLEPINGANCIGKYDFSKNGRSDWEISCGDGVKAQGSMITKGPGKGSNGSGFDNKRNKITFELAPAPVS